MPNLKRYDPASRPDVEWWHIVVLATVVFMLVIPVAIYPIPAHHPFRLDAATVIK